MRTCTLFLVVLISAVSLRAEVPEYRELRAARPDGRVVMVENLVLVRDVYEFTFTRGTFHLLAPLSNGRTFGAVFLGEGEFRLTPGSETERRHLALVTGDRSLRSLNDSFTEMILLFGDRTTVDIHVGGIADVLSPHPDAIAAWDRYLGHQKRELQLNLHLRLLRDTLNSPGPGVFLVSVDGREFPPALLAIDPQGIGSLAAGLSIYGGEEVAYLSLDRTNGGFWYLGALGAGSAEPEGKAVSSSVDALSYQIETNIAPDAAIRGVTTVTLRPLVKGIRVLPVHILPKLRLRKAAWSTDGTTWVDAEAIQEEVELGRFRRLFVDEVADSDAAVVFGEALVQGEPIRLRLEYDGRDVLEKGPAETWSVRARESWYPNLGAFTDAADYELTFRFPKKYQLIATGTRLREEPEGNGVVSLWKSSKPMWVAGFNYGRFEKMSRTDEPSGASVDLYTTRDFRKTAGDSMIDAINTARVATVFFGPVPFTPISITQQVEWNFGQSWPSLIYLPPLALTTSTERAFMSESMGPAAMADIQEFARMVGWHEFAHQWWGHEVGWQSYRDQWLSEGFAEFTAALVLQVTEKPGTYERYWERRRREIVEQQRGGVVYADAGPVSNGFRMATRETPDGVSTLVYSKGAWVLHMLRRMMADSSKPNPDEAFIAMMKDYVETWRGKKPSTADFGRVVDRHITPAMNVGSDGTMKWFFDQWIRGIEIPRLSSKLEIEALDGGRYRIHGTITQSDVPDDFRTIVPIYLEFGSGEWVMLGRALLIGGKVLPVDVQLELPKAPRRAEINVMQDVLVRK